MMMQEGWTHLDYIISMDADIYVYSLVMGLLNDFHREHGMPVIEHV
jgi:hypothetical protein